jgi:[ribosomal protein S18]-alanine N-acetyltransferase
MVTTYFKRYRMESSLDQLDRERPSVAPAVRLLPWSAGLLRDHALAKFESFRHEIDATVFPCLARKDGCYQLMKELVHRNDFVPEATWLAVRQELNQGRWIPIGTIQGLRVSKELGSIQNVGIVPAFRGIGLGSVLLLEALRGFAAVGCQQATLEVTVQNTAAIRLYERLGFHRAEIVFKIAEVPYD